MKVVVTGGAGYIGSVAVERLLEQGHDVVVLDNLWRGHRTAVAKDAEFRNVDIRDLDSVLSVIGETKPDAVLHFAAATLVPESVKMPDDYFATNVVGTRNVLAGITKWEVPKFVFSSTAAVYGEPDATTIPESAPEKPINPYGVSKYVTEQLLPSYFNAYGLSYVIFRYFNVAGATESHGEDHRPETHVVPVALETLLGRRETFRLFGTDYPTPDGSAIRDYVHVVDLVDAHLLALDQLERPLGVFNLGSKDGFSVRQLIDAVERVTGMRLPVEEAPRREGDPPMLVADSSRARELLGWRPTRSTLDDMIGSAWDWMRRNPHGYVD